MADYADVYGRGLRLTQAAGAAITGGQLVTTTADNTVSPTGANSPSFFGVAGHDAALGAPVSVLCGDTRVHETASSGAIAAGALVQADAAGVVKAVATGLAIGVAMKAAAGGVCRWKPFF